MDGGGQGGYRLMNFASGRVQDEPPTIINRMMQLRFRPIAPKPPAGEGFGSTPTSSRLVPTVRRKRKYVRVRALTRKKKNDSSSDKQPGDSRAADLSSEHPPATLQLLPGSVEPSGQRSDGESSVPTTTSPTDNNNDENSSLQQPLHGGVAAVETWVTAGEGVSTGGCMDDMGLLPRIRMEDLEGDTCPAFVSDGEGKVKWVNDAYREMVATAAAADEEEKGNKVVVVRLVVEEKLRPYFHGCRAFSCWVGLRFRANGGHGGWSIMRVPCDVWKMGEGYAWRLDIKVALKLGL